jgi:hypothetical protein
MIRTVLAPGVAWPTPNFVPQPPPKPRGFTRKFTDEICMKIREERAAGKSYRQLGREYSVASETIRGIILKMGTYK